MKLVFRNRDAELYFTGEDSRGQLHWSNVKSMAKTFDADIKDKNIGTLNRFLNEYFGNFWEYNDVSKSEYIAKIKSKFPINEAVFLLRCHNEKVKVKVEKYG